MSKKEKWPYARDMIHHHFLLVGKSDLIFAFTMSLTFRVTFKINDCSEAKITIIKITIQLSIFL